MIKEIEAGNRLAAKQLVDSFQVRVYNICFSLLHNIHDAEDITQEVFIEVLQHLHTFRGDSELGTWIYRIAVNRSLNFIRKNKKLRWWKQVDDFLTFKETDSDEPLIYNQPTEQEEEKRILYKAIDSLPDNQRIAFTLNKIDEFSYNDVAQTMNISHAAVESLLHRAKLNLQKSLKKYYDYE
jgi:RNA polymerase sigma-70 factor, ECF subfamily